MIQTAIIGAGQLGSRHLQGILKSSNDFVVHVVDPFEDSLKVAERRAGEINHEHKVHYHTSLSKLPEILDFVVIATNSDVRLEVLKSLVSHASVKTLILEKVLFQTVNAFQEAFDIIETHGIRCYVNHPRRSQDVYQMIRNEVADNQIEMFEIDVYGVNWGLGCNGLHFSDIIEFVFNDKVDSYSINELDPILIKSKRKGFYEFTGTLKGQTEMGHRFRITSRNAQDGRLAPLSITLNSPSIRLWVSEASGKPVYLREKYSPELHRDFLELKLLRFQSDLTGELLELALLGKELPLTEYKMAMNNHVKFIEALLGHVEKVTSSKTKICPIT